jgi:hypothetical protein
MAMTKCAPDVGPDDAIALIGLRAGRAVGRRLDPGLEREIQRRRVVDPHKVVRAVELHGFIAVERQSARLTDEGAAVVGAVVRADFVRRRNRVGRLAKAIVMGR